MALQPYRLSPYKRMRLWLVARLAPAIIITAIWYLDEIDVKDPAWKLRFWLLIAMNMGVAHLAIMAFKRLEKWRKGRGPTMRSLPRAEARRAPPGHREERVRPDMPG